MQLRTLDRRADRDATLLLVALALVHVIVHLATNGNYGIFRDELYYIACSKHLAWGYVDHPPLSIGVLTLTRWLFGDSAFAIRIPAAIAGGAAVFLTGRLARAFGGGYDAQWIAALAYSTAAVPLVIFGYFSMNAFDLLFWILCAHAGARILGGGDRRWWLAFGLVAGLGLLNKYSVGFFTAAFVVGIALTPERRQLLGAWPWLGGALATLLFLPHVLWELEHGLPTLEFIRTAQAEKNMPMSPLQFFTAQLIEGNPFIAPIWLIGLAGFFVSPALRRYRAFGWTYLALLVLFVAQHGKPYYLAPVYPILLAAGAVTIGAWVARRRFLRWALAGWVVLGGIVLAPMALPILPPDALIAYAQTLGIMPAQAERSHTGPLPQHFADRFGWENQARTVAAVYMALPPSQREVAAIVTRNYGEAGAIDYFGPGLGLPAAISGHNNYWLWGPGEATGKILITVGFPQAEIDPLCARVDFGATVISPHAMPYETDLPVLVCHDLQIPIEEAWRKLKRFV